MRCDGSLQKKPPVSEEMHIFKADGCCSHRYIDLVVGRLCDASTVPCHSDLLIIDYSSTAYRYLES